MHFLAILLETHYFTTGKSINLLQLDAASQQDLWISGWEMTRNSGNLDQLRIWGQPRQWKENPSVRNQGEKNPSKEWIPLGRGAVS